MNGWIALARLTLTDPRSAAPQVVALGLPNQVWWMALALCAVVSAMFMQLQLQLLIMNQPVDGPQIVPLFGGPIRTAILVFVVSALTVWSMAKVGQVFGGAGSVSHALALSAWLQVLMTVLSLGIGIVGMVLPMVDLLASLVLFVLSVWILVVFVAQMHGFQNLLLVFGGVVVTSFLVLLVLSSLAVALGFVVVPEGT